MKNLICFFIFLFCFDLNGQSTDVMQLVEHGYADNNGVKIHYATMGEGPLVVMIHGFPDFWYSWRHQMEALSDTYKVVAVDLRGYNKSDKPKGVANYAMPLLVSDIMAVIKHHGADKAIIIGHDWGGAISWAFAMSQPEWIEKLIICNLPHPRGLARELVNNPKQRENSQYARNFQKENAHEGITAEALARWINDETVKEKYIAAYRRSDFEAMLNYYKANYPSAESYEEDVSEVVKVQCPVLMIHGLEDWALLPGALNDTGNWLEKDLTLVTIPGAGHFVQHDASDMVTRSILMWLNR